VNHLAHFLLAAPEPALIAGALMGDFQKGPLPGRLPQSLAAGVKLHRLIDSFTDQHLITQQARVRFGPQRRLAGIVLDVYFDRYLSRHWSRFCEHSLAHFNRQILAVLDDHRAHLVPPAEQLERRFRQHSILCRYHEESMIEAILTRIGERLQLAPQMQAAMALARHQQTDIEADFLVFFPELITFCHQQKPLISAGLVTQSR